jgi:hypothetical protein
VRFRIDVNTLDGRLSFHKDAPADALEVAKGAKANLGVTITDTQDSATYSLQDFEARFLDGFASSAPA